MNYQYERNNIESIIEELLNKFNLEENISSESSTTNSKKYRTEKILPVRKVGLKVTNLISISNNNDNNNNKNKQFRQMTLSDYL